MTRTSSTIPSLQNLRDVVQPPKNDTQTGGEHTISLQAIQKAVFDTLKAAAQRRHPGDARARFTIAMIQYALGSFGERSRSHETWIDASNFLAWLNADPEMFGPARPLPDPIWTGTPTPWIVPATLPPVMPAVVVKNFRPIDAPVGAASNEDGNILTRVDEALVRRRRQEPFDPDRIRQSLSNALYGRPDSVHDVELLYHWVMWGFPGQAVLRTSQISSRIAETLRALDDIAYLRWVVVGKELTVSQVRTEAEGLIIYPSQRLKLSRSQLPPPLSQGTGSRE